MKKLFLVGLLLSALVAGAKGRVTVKIAEGSENPEIESLLGLLDASQAVATIVADSIDAPLYAVWMVNYSGDEPTRKLAGYVPVQPDSTRIFIAAMAKDSLTVQINIRNSSRQRVSIPTASHSLIGCGGERTYNNVDTIPLMAYTTGIPTKRRLADGNEVEAFYFCGIRDTKEHPSRWKKLYNLPEFLYFEAIPVKQFGL
ncbi:MAG: hypothetical protein HDS49_05940 [Bacteroides sp.]|nr:hypothetical protein [Bacteroides sp.]